MGPRAGLDRCGKSLPIGIRSPDHPVRSESLYQLSYTGLYIIFSQRVTQPLNMSLSQLQFIVHLCILHTCVYIYTYICIYIYVGIATDYELDDPGIESRWRRDFPPVQNGPGAHPASCKMGTVSFPGVKCGRGVLLTTHPVLVPRSWKIRAIPVPTLWATPGL